ncbi:flippase-like domain-containing protein [Agrobacterium larrymoorei]|uniref:lysylphosphatidylglycerol synthase transmembrane domain-containing protein n=1 Tax=Agrobacterium larrymoorei TaxID=160699 RepID=UPI0015735C6F|nr:lysylphosphatidylglycerol synthase transmembrane domain-containing protein [Agrobacterium larrymoorei]NTJ43917.1 flippase-like domain-containing protein [Agrobacterium larrymoorei]
MEIRSSSALRIFLSFLCLTFLVWLLWHTDHANLFQSLTNISLPAIVLSLVLVQVQIILSAIRWRFTSGRLGTNIAVGTTIREYYVASILNQTLPGGIGGDVIRAWRMRSVDSGGWKQPTKAIVFERASGQIAFFLVSIIGLFIYPSMVASSPITSIAILLVVGVVFSALTILFFVVLSRKFKAWAVLSGEIFDAFISRKAWIVQLCLSASILACYIGVFFIAANATGSQLPLVAMITIIPFCLTAILIPVGFGGWGTREAAAMALWPMLGATAAEGLAASITYGWLSLVGASPGLVILAFDALRRKTRAV